MLRNHITEFKSSSGKSWQDLLQGPDHISDTFIPYLLYYLLLDIGEVAIRGQISPLQPF